LGAARCGLARRPTPGLPPATAGTRAIARSERGPASSAGIPVPAGPVGALAAPARLHPPRLAGAHETREPLRADLLARRPPWPGPDLVDDDDLGHMVLDRLDHHLVLEGRGPDLHPAGLADRRVRDVAVAGDLVAGVDHDDPLAVLVGEDTRGLTQHRRLADAGP